MLTPRQEQTLGLEVETGLAQLRRRLGEPGSPPTLGRYELRRNLGRGGMGQVFEAWDPQLRRAVAVKVLFDDPGEAALREARCLARVCHPNVVSVYEVGASEGRLFIAMELVDGPSFGRWLSEHPRGWMEVVEQIVAAARGLEAVHDAGLCHGDLKPANLLIGAEGQLRVADFGLARAAGGGEQGGGEDEARPRWPGPCAALVAEAVRAVEDEQGIERAATVDPGPEVSVEAQASDSRLPELLDDLRSLLRRRGEGEAALLGGPGGTLPYMAPECLMGRVGGPAADQYSLCATAWEALFGRRPYAGRDAAGLLGSIAAGRLRRPREKRRRQVPAAVEAILRRGLDEDPARRWPSMAAFADALAGVEDQRRRRRRRLGLGLSGLAMGASLAVLLGLRVDRGACLARGEGVERLWTPSARARLQARYEADEARATPRSEQRFVIAGLDRWVQDYAQLWAGVCRRPDPDRRRCLVEEGERFSAALALLDQPAGLAAGRSLVVELGSPRACLDPGGREPLSSEAFPALAELAAAARRVELATRAGMLDRAAVELRSFDEAAARTPGDRGAAIILGVERWRARLELLRGEAEAAERILLRAIEASERRGLDSQRFALELERLRAWSHSRRPKTSERVVEAVRRVEALGERLVLRPQQGLDAALTRANALAEHDPRGARVALSEAEQIAAAGVARRGLETARLELELARASVFANSDEPEAAMAAARRAIGLADRSFAADSPLLALAYATTVRTAVVAGDEEFARALLGRLYRQTWAGEPERLAALALSLDAASPELRAQVELVLTRVRGAIDDPRLAAEIRGVWVGFGSGQAPLD